MTNDAAENYKIWWELEKQHPKAMKTYREIIEEQEEESEKDKEWSLNKKTKYEEANLPKRVRMMKEWKEWVRGMYKNTKVEKKQKAEEDVRGERRKKRKEDEEEEAARKKEQEEKEKIEKLRYQKWKEQEAADRQREEVRRKRYEEEQKKKTGDGKSVNSEEIKRKREEEAEKKRKRQEAWDRAIKEDDEMYFDEAEEAERLRKQNKYESGIISDSEFQQFQDLIRSKHKDDKSRNLDDLDSPEFRKQLEERFASKASELANDPDMIANLEKNLKR